MIIGMLVYAQFLIHVLTRENSFPTLPPASPIHPKNDTDFPIKTNWNFILLFFFKVYTFYPFPIFTLKSQRLHTQFPSPSSLLHLPYLYVFTILKGKFDCCVEDVEHRLHAVEDMWKSHLSASWDRTHLVRIAWQMLYPMSYLFGPFLSLNYNG